MISSPCAEGPHPAPAIDHPTSSPMFWNLGHRWGGGLNLILALPPSPQAPAVFIAKKNWFHRATVKILKEKKIRCGEGTNRTWQIEGNYCKSHLNIFV